MKVQGHYTVSGTACLEQVIDKSRFIAHIKHVSSADEVEEHMRSVQTQYPNAKHYVYAYRLHGGRLEKASDDGEPQGTGGRPVLDLLQYRTLWNVQIIVVRYFGGIKLGTGGLTRAYGGTARLVLDEAAEIVLLSPHTEYELQIPYSWYEQIKYHVFQNKWQVENEQFQENVRVVISIPQEETKTFENWLDEFTNKQVVRKTIKERLKPVRK